LIFLSSAFTGKSSGFSGCLVFGMMYPFTLPERGGRRLTPSQL
jgi:hypothetical protein